jgi:hypothetical protein
VTHLANVREADRRTAYLRVHRYEWFAAVIFGIAGPVLFIPGVHQDSAIAEVLPPWLEWIAFGVYASGGVMALFGMWNLRPNYEAAGFALLAGFWAVDTIAIYGVRSVGGALVTAATIFASIFCAARARDVLRHYRR